MFARHLQSIQDEKCQHQPPISEQYPNEYDKDFPYPWTIMSNLTKVTDRLIVQTPTIVNQPFIHDESTRREGEVSRKHQ